MNLASLLLRTAEESPDAPALLGTSAAVSFGELAERSALLAGRLADDGVGPGDRVALVLGNDDAFVVGYLGVLSVGAVAVPLNPASPAPELDRELAAVSPSAVLRDRSDTDGSGHTPRASVERADSDLAALLFTSGTAGAPRAAMLTHGNLAANIGQVLSQSGVSLERGDVGFGALPFFHVFGLNVALGVALAAGAPVVLVPAFDPAGALELIRRFRVTVLAGVPTMYAAWLALPPADAPADSFGTVRVATSGAAPLTPEVLDGMRDRFGVELHEGYGLTEASPSVTSSIGGPARRAGLIGRPLPGLEVRLVDVDGGDVAVGDPGEIWVRGPNVFAGYWNDPDATRQVLTDDGWLVTGDVAVADEEGSLELVDRVKDLVIVSGFNVFPAEVEEVLREHPEVADAAVAGRSDPRTGEVVAAWVVAEPGCRPEPEALRSWAGSRLARYKVPASVEIVDALPRTPVGKVLRRALPDDDSSEGRRRGLDTRNPA